MSEVKRYLIQKTPIGTMMKPNPEGNWIDGEDFDRVTAERDSLQAQLTAENERADRLECEVGRLKKISDNYCSLLMDANSRLSVADLAVGAIKSWTEETRESVLESFQAELNDSASYEWYDNAISDLMKLVCALKPAEAPRNQCDGCQAGIPVVSGAHRMGKTGGYPDTMSCTAKIYKPAEGGGR